MHRKTNRIYHRSLMQTEKSQSEGKRTMAETKFTEFQELSTDPRVEISPSASETDDRIFLLPVIGKIEVLKNIYNNICKQLMSHTVSHVNCLSVRARQNFPAPQKVEQTLSHR